MRRLARMADFLTKRADAGIKTIATHDGSFHCDEALACFLLKLLPELKGALKLPRNSAQHSSKLNIAPVLIRQNGRSVLSVAPADTRIVRTRDPAVLETSDIVVDVGGVFDAARHRYDHHQRHVCRERCPNSRAAASSRTRCTAWTRASRG